MRSLFIIHRFDKVCVAMRSLFIIHRFDKVCVP